MSISEMNLKTIKIKKTREGLAVPSFQLRGEICGHGAPIQKRKKKLREKERKQAKKHT